MRRLTRAWPWLVVLVLAAGCGRGSPTSPTDWSNSVGFRDCSLPTRGAMTATIDGTPWIAVSTRATQTGVGITLRASDCTHVLEISIRNFRGLGTYDVTQGDFRPGRFIPDAEADLQCDGRGCGAWVTTVSDGRIFSVDGRGTVTVTSYTAATGNPADLDNFSGKIEGTFSITLVPLEFTGATGTRVLTDGRFGSDCVDSESAS